MNRATKVHTPNTGALAESIKRAVDLYFKDQAKEKTGDWRLFLKAAIITVLFIGTYLCLLFVHSPPLVKFLEAVFLGILTAAIGFCIMHDAAHRSFFSPKKNNWNYVFALTLNFLGGNALLWDKKHNQMHHAHTNLNELDDDIEAGPFLRLHYEQQRRWIHRFQHRWWYWIGMYSLLYAFWIWGTDFKKYFSGRILKTKIRFSFSDHVIFWVSKMVHAFFFIVLPIMSVGVTSWAIGYTIVLLVCGVTISTVFQLAHIVEGVSHPSVKETNGKEFFRHQIETTADFATNNRWVSWWVGGLNFQVEHHLFPRVSHVHYPAIHKIVKPLCEKNGVPMTVHPTVFSALKAHVARLKELGKEPLSVS